VTDQHETDGAHQPYGRNHRVGVLDIGSNSVRLVVYDHAGRSPIPVFNEKALCALGRGVSETGLLPAEGMASAIANIERYSRISKAMRVKRLDVVATSAVRDASNGGSFVAEVEERLGHPVKVIDGAEEARLAALGVLNAFPAADGVVGDLGGGSLELIDVGGVDQGPKGLGNHVTMPLGPLRLGLVERGHSAALAKVIDGHLDTAEWLGALKGRTLYAVGGAWRSIAKAHMSVTKHPIEVIHGYSVETGTLSRFLDEIGEMTNKEIRSIDGVSRRRADTLSTAALVFKRVLERGKPASVMFSAYGVREGCLFDKLDESARNQDPLLQAAAEVARETNRFAPQPEAVLEWIQPLFPDLKVDDARLMHALCMLSDIGWSEHPSYRGEHAFLKVLRMPVAGINHADRVFLGLGVLARYTGGVSLPQVRAVKPLLSEERQALALKIGLALRLGLTLSGGTTGLLRKTRIDPTEQGFTLTLSGDASVLMGDVVERRITALSDAIKLPIEVVLKKSRPKRP
jgi:exopolyphosphatase/guanosine-5'-triphosphate,3'-diphosphate pyrophosphatase